MIQSVKEKGKQNSVYKEWESDILKQEISY